MKYLLFLIGCNVFVSAMNEHCISGPTREYSFLYCPPTNANNISINDQSVDSVKSGHYSMVLLGTVTPMALTLAAGLLRGRGNHSAYVAKSVVCVGMISVVVGSTLLALADSRQLHDFPYAWDNIIFWYSTIAGCLVGKEMLSVLPALRRM